MERREKERESERFAGAWYVAPPLASNHLLLGGVDIHMITKRTYADLRRQWYARATYIHKLDNGRLRFDPRSLWRTHDNVFGSLAIRQCREFFSVAYYLFLSRSFIFFLAFSFLLFIIFLLYFLFSFRYFSFLARAQARRWRCVVECERRRYRERVRKGRSKDRGHLYRNFILYNTCV